MVYYRRKVSLTAFFLYKEKIKAPRTWQLHHQGQSVTTVTVQWSPSVNVESMCQPQHTTHVTHRSLCSRKSWITPTRDACNNCWELRDGKPEQLRQRFQQGRPGEWWRRWLTATQTGAEWCLHQLSEKHSYHYLALGTWWAVLKSLRGSAFQMWWEVR